MKFYVIFLVFIIFFFKFAWLYDYNSTECELARKLHESGFGIAEIGTRKFNKKKKNKTM